MMGRLRTAPSVTSLAPSPIPLGPHYTPAIFRLDPIWEPLRATGGTSENSSRNASQAGRRKSRLRQEAKAASGCATVGARMHGGRSLGLNGRDALDCLKVR
jgi:hypothetical protein